MTKRLVISGAVGVLTVIPLCSAIATDVVTSEVVAGFCIVTDTSISTVFLARTQGDKIEKLFRITSRNETDEPDKIVHSKDSLVVLICGPGTRYEHYFISLKTEPTLLESPFRGAIGGDSAIVVDGYILGTLWIPEASVESDPGNYMYVFSPTGALKVGRLPGLSEGYNIENKGRLSFTLLLWNTLNARIVKTTHRLPFTMKDGWWQLGLRKD